MRRRSGNKFELFSFTLDQAQPGWNDSALRQWLKERSIPHEILTRDTYSIVKEKSPKAKPIVLCVRDYDEALFIVTRKKMVLTKLLSAIIEMIWYEP